MRKKQYRWVIWIALLYGLIGIVFYYLQNRILFHPIPLARNYDYHFSVPHTEINLAYDKETNLNIVQFHSYPDSTPKGVVLYFHGNRNNIERYAQYAGNFTIRGYDVWMIDYPGFGKSTGPFTEEKLYDYALQLYRLARSRFSPAQIVIYGKSFGTCLASQLAAVRDCKSLILETPCYSMKALVSHWLPIYPVENLLHFQFPTNEYLLKVTAPIIIFHGTSDGLIPYRHAKKLTALLKPGDKFITIENGTHNNLNDFPLFHQVLDSLLSN